MDKKTYDKYFEKLKQIVLDNGYTLNENGNKCAVYWDYKEIRLSDDEINIEIPNLFPKLKECSDYERKLTLFLHEVGHILDRNSGNMGTQHTMFKTQEERIFDEIRGNEEAEKLAKVIEFPVNREYLWECFKSYLINLAS